jgi:hypothetical protein
VKVLFFEVGRSKANFEAEYKGELIYEWLYEQVKPYLMSDTIDFTEDGKIVVGGFRVVGRFQIV